MAKGPVGSIFGYELLLAGTDVPYGRPRRWRLPDGMDVITGDVSSALEAYLRAYTLDSLAGAAAQLTAKRLLKWDDFKSRLDDVGWDHRVLLSPMSLRRLMDAAVRSRELPDKARTQIDLTALRRSEEMLFDVVPITDTLESKSNEAVMAMVLRTLQFQFPDQMGLDHYRQEICICLDTIKEAANGGLDLDATFRQAFGLTFSEIAFLCFGIFAEINANPEARFNSRDLNRNGAFKVSPEVIEAFWRHCAMTFDQYRERMNDPDVSVPGYEPYSFSPLIKWPLLIRSDGNAVVPVANDIFQRPFRGFLLDSLQAIDQVAPKSKGSFLKALGNAYERYVGDSLTAAGAKVESGDDFFGTEGKHCDWVVLERNQTCLIEVKGVWIRFDASMTKDRHRLKKALSRNGSLADALVQLEESSKSIRSGVTSIPKNRPRVGLIVVKGDQVGLNSPFVRDLLEEILLERGLAKPTIRYQLTNDLGFSHLVKFVSSGRQLGKTLHEKLKDGIRKYDDMHFVVERQLRVLPPHPLFKNHDERVSALLDQYCPGYMLKKAVR